MTHFMALKIMVTEPITSASVNTATAVKPGFRSPRRTYSSGHRKQLKC